MKANPLIRVGTSCSPRAIAFWFGLFTCLIAPASVQASTYYVSASSGSDTYNASQAQSLSTPWKTIQKAATNMVAGDTCLIQSGTYRETVTVPASGSGTNGYITFQAGSGQTVQVSGADVVSGTWTEESTNIYYAALSSTLGVRNQVFQNSTMKPESRWPNAGVQFPFQDSSAYPSTDWAYVTTAGTSGSTWWFTSTGTTGLPIRPDNYWNGATLNIMAGDGWYIKVATVTGYTSSSQQLATNYVSSNNGAYSVNPGNEYYLSGVKGELDSDGEWYYDSANARLYVFSSIGAPANVEAKLRNYGFNLSSRTYIKLVGLNLFGCTIQTDSSSNCVLDGLTMRYLGHSTVPTSPSGIILRNGYVLRNCDIGYNADALIQLAGSNIRVINNHLHDSGYMPVYEMICTPATSSTANLISHNTIHDAGRGLVSGVGSKAIFEYNDLYNGMRMTSDGAAMHANGPTSGTIVRYNLMHDVQGVAHHSGNSVQGFYLDCNNSDWVVHHNILWNINGTTIQLNNRQNYNMYFNNSCVSATSGALSSEFASDAVPATEDNYEAASGTYFFNNLFCSLLPSSTTWKECKFVNNIFTTGTDTANLYVDLSGSDFRLRSSSDAIDQGVVIPGVTDGYVGDMPDIGALEYGGTDWRILCGCSSTALNPEPTYSYPSMIFPNQIRNDSFESGALLPNWTATPSTNVSLLNASSWTDSRVHMGNWDAVIGGTGAELSQTVTGLLPNKRYNLYFGAKTTGTANAISFGVRNYGRSAISGNVAVSDTNWQVNNLSFFTGSSSSSAQIYAAAAITSGTVFMDDFSLQLCQPSVEVDLPMLLYYSLNETSGTVASDYGTLGLSGCFYGTMSGTNANGWTTGTFGNAAKFNGTDGYILTQGVATPADATITFWAKSDNATWNRGSFVYKPSSFMIVPSIGKKDITFIVWVSSGNWYINWVPPSDFDITQWHHYAFTISPETVGASYVTQLIVDGTLRDMRWITTPATMNSDPTNTLYIGGYPAESRYLAGAMDDVRFYDYALTIHEIFQVMHRDSSKVLHLRLDDGSGATHAHDSTGHSNGTLTNVASTDWNSDGMINGALHLNGTNSYVTCPSVPTPADATISFWAKSDTTTWNNGYFINKSPSFVFYPESGGKAIYFIVWVSGTNWYIRWTPPAGFDITQWHHYVGTISPETGGVSFVSSLYVDGGWKDGRSVATPNVMLTDPTNTMVIGRKSSSGQNFLGSIDDVRFYNRALNGNEVFELYHETNQPPY